MNWKMLLTLPVAGLTVAAAAQDNDATKEFAKFKGQWKVVSLVRQGTDASTRNTMVTVSQQTWAITVGDNVQSSASMKIDLSKQPKTIDSEFNEGPDQGKTLKGIYQLQGDDWKVLFSGPGKDRPRSFPDKPDAAYLLIVMKRAGK